jgi:hypothetical protein
MYDRGRFVRSMDRLMDLIKRSIGEHDGWSANAPSV